MKQYIVKNISYRTRCAFIHTGGTPLFYDCILNDTDGEKMKLISIVIPCYNSEATIPGKL